MDNGGESIDAANSTKHVLREAHDVGCFGLVGGEAIQMKTGVRIAAHIAQRSDGPFACPRCWTKAIVHKDRGGGRIDHFAHNAPLTPLIPHGESEIHRVAKNEICDALKALAPDGKWEVERRIQKNEKRETPDLVPDISGYLGKQPLVIEVQWSTLSLATILKRSKAYFRWRTPVLWILPLREDFTGEFRPRSFERYLHSMYFGRVYYWRQGDGLRVTPTHYVPVQRWIDTREWTDAEGEQSGGGFQKMLRVVKTAHTTAPIDITRDFFAEERNEFRPWNEKRIVHACGYGETTLARGGTKRAKRQSARHGTERLSNGVRTNRCKPSRHRSKSPSRSGRKWRVFAQHAVSGK